MPALQKLGGRYTLRERIGAGGMGEVWLARDEGPDGFQKTVVVKRLLPEAARYLDYFKAEARLVAQLPHQNIVQVLNFFVDEDGQHNIVMEYVEGTDVEDLIFGDRGRLSVEMAVYIAAEALKGLEFAHQARIDRAHAEVVHRDISPHNLLVSFGAEVKVTDFGIAKAAVEYREKTEGNKFRGKIAYAAPESLEERVDVPPDRRVDVYAMGVVLREMLTQERTFTGTLWQTLVAVKEGQVRPLAEAAPHVPPTVRAIVEKMMHRDREQRYATAAEARAALVRAVPDWAVADDALRAFVHKVARRRPRLTSPFVEGDGDGSPMHVREEGTPEPIPTLIKAGPDEPTRMATERTRPGHLGGGLAPELAPTLPAHGHEQPTQLLAKTAILPDGATPLPVAKTVSAATVTHVGRRALRDWGRFLVGVGAAFAVSAGVLYTVKQQHRPPVLPSPALSANPNPTPTPNPNPNPNANPIANPDPNPDPGPIPPPSPPPPLHAKRPRTHDIPSDLGALTVGHPSADVSVDGVYVGHSPLRHLIAPGAHRVSLFDTKTFRRASLDVKVGAGRVTNVEFPVE